MTEPAPVVVDEDIASLAHRLRSVTNEIAKMQAVADDIKAKLRSTGVAVGAAAVDANGNRLFAIQANRRFDVEQAAALLPSDDLRAACRVQSYDPKAVKKLLPPVLVEKCMVPVGEPKVVLT